MKQNPTPFDIMRNYLQRGDAIGWFDELYAAADGDARNVPWAEMVANPHLVSWMNEHGVKGDGRRALVVGCGLGDDAEELARQGFVVTAFDVSERAIAWCKQRFSNSSVQYVAVDLFQPLQDWLRAFDFVMESRTIQSLPPNLRDSCISCIAKFVAPGGLLWVMCVGREDDAVVSGPPWPVSRADLKLFEDNGLTLELFENHVQPAGYSQFRVVYRRVVGAA